MAEKLNRPAEQKRPPVTATPDGMVAKTLAGLEPLLAGELVKLGASGVKEGKRVVYFNGDKALMYKANYCCRTALSILKPVHSFQCRSEEELYREVKNMEWEKYMGKDDTLSVDGVTFNSAITHSKFLALKTKDAIVDRFRDKFGSRPSVDVRRPTLRINVHLSDNWCNISLDSSGENLSRRGYRIEAEEAPLNEVLAAGMILWSGWDTATPFIDPMCGSGTLVAEAALMAMRIPPGSLRGRFGFQNWKDFDFELWKKMKGEADRLRHSTLNTTIIGSDISGPALSVARANLQRAGVERFIKLQKMPFDQQVPPPGQGTVMMNPPYGQRLKPEDIEALYTSIGNQLKKHYAGYAAWILTSNLDAAKHIGLKPSRKIVLFNGGLECRFLRFDMYTGTKKLHKVKKEENS